MFLCFTDSELHFCEGLIEVNYDKNKWLVANIREKQLLLKN